MLVKKEIEGQIYDGNTYWPDSIQRGLLKLSVGKELYDFYSDMPGSLYESLCRSARMWPERNCIVDDSGKAYTYSQLLKMTNDFAKVLFHLYHVKAGMHVGILLYNGIEFCVSIYAINSLRAVAVPFSTKYRQPETVSLMEKADLTGMILHRDFVSWFCPEREDLFLICTDGEEIVRMSSGSLFPKVPEQLQRMEDMAILMFTSGTTSRSKGVQMANYNVMHAITVYQKIFRITEEDRTVLPVPAYHVTGLVAVMGLFIHAGGCIWIHKYFNAARVLTEMRNHDITFFHASPTVFSLLLEQKEEFQDLKSIRIFACGSSNMPKQKIKELKEWMPQADFHTVYGLTETTSPATIFPDGAADSPHIGSSGRPVPGIRFMICGDAGELLPPYETGTVMIKGSTVTTGYYQSQKEKLTDSVKNLIQEGWLDTGDLGYFDEDGYLYLVDRKKDMINRGGEKICSFDVENVLYTMEGIREAAVVGIADEKYGEVPAAMVVADESSGLNAEKIRNYLKLHLAKFQIPVKLVFTHSLPMTPNMKVDKKRIRELLAQN